MQRVAVLFRKQNGRIQPISISMVVEIFNHLYTVQKHITQLIVSLSSKLITILLLSEKWAKHFRALNGNIKPFSIA